MLPSLKLGRVFGIPVYLHSSLLLLPIWVIYTRLDSGWPTVLFMLAVTASTFACVLLHEFGHALMARWFGIVTRDVTLYPIGGVARLERMSEKPVEEVFIALAGPAVNVVIAAVLTPVVFVFALVAANMFLDPLSVSLDEPGLQWAAKLCFVLWFSNIVLVLFNLLPAFPMDGGRVLRAVLAHFFGLLRGTEIAVPIGIGVAALVCLGMMGMSAVSGEFNPFPLFIFTFVALLGPLELRVLRHREQQKRVAELAQPQLTPSDAVPFLPLPYPDEENSTRKQPGFTGYTWDREFGVWVKWQNAARVAAHWNGSE